MTENSHLLDGNDKKKVNWFSRFLKLFFILLAFCLVIITILANMGGTSDMLKESVVEFVSTMSGGRPVEVEKLNNVSFFPNVGVDVEGINIISRPENGAKLISIGKVQAYMGFWHVATSRPRLKVFYLEGIKAIRGAIFPNELFIEKVFIDHDIEKQQAFLKGVGKVGIHPLDFSAEMQVFGSKGKYTFMLARNFEVEVEIADIKFEAKLVNHEDNYFKLENFRLSKGDKLISGNILISGAGADLLKIRSDIKTNNTSTVINAELIADLSEKINKYSGTLISEKIVLSDILGDDSVFTIFERVRDILGYTRLQQDENPMGLLGSNELKLELDFKNIEIANGTTVNLVTPLHLEKGHLRLSNILAVPLEKEILTITHNDDQAQNITFLRPYLPVITENQNITECVIEKAGKKLQEITLESFSYDFVQSSLREKSEFNECAERVKKVPEPETTEKQEQDTQNAAPILQEQK